MPDAPAGRTGRIERGGARGEAPRVLLFSGRNTIVHKYEASQLEFEDVIASVDSVDLLAPKFHVNGPLDGTLSQVKNVVRRGMHMRKSWPIDPVTIDRDYDLFFAIFHFAPNLAYLDRLRGWRRRSRRAVCFLIEMWSKQIPDHRVYLRLLEEFDQVFVFNARTVDTLRDVAGCTCAFLPTATDVLRWTPMPEQPPRDIDVYSIGRGPSGVHEQLLSLAERRERVYVHDRVNHALPDHRAHRLLQATLMQRSRYFLAHRINDDVARVRSTGGEEALPTRFFEGAAGGAVMLGSHPDVPEWRECFGWPDASIPLPWDSTDVRGLLAELDEQPERIERARRLNIANSLRRHDWVHRWARVLDSVGLPHTPAMRERMLRLDALADLTGVADGDTGAAREVADSPRGAAAMRAS